MDLETTIERMEAEEGQMKSAAALPASPAKTNLDAALEKAAAAPAPATPVVQEMDAVDALMKTANALAGTEKEADIAHAAICGQAFADGAISKLAAYDAQVQRAVLETTKQAAAVGAPAAQSDDDLIKAAAEQGYQDTLEKMSAEYQSGHDDALQQVHDQAATEFLKGAAEVEALVDIAAQQG